MIVAADDVTSDTLLPWVGSGFLASGAAATDEVVEEAALPFDRRRHGMILGMGAAGIVVESAAAARERGITPICEVLGAVTANSAFHGSRLDVEHIGGVMEAVVAPGRGARRRRATRSPPETVFVSHETYTPARGGSAAAEIHALRQVFGADADAIVIANTQGHDRPPDGRRHRGRRSPSRRSRPASCRRCPTSATSTRSSAQLNLSHGGAYPVRYALRLAAGFGSQISMILLRWTPLADGRRRTPDELGYDYRIADRPAWSAWLTRVSGQDDPRLEVVRHARVARGAPGVPAAAPRRPAPAARRPPRAGRRAGSAGGAGRAPAVARATA